MQENPESQEKKVTKGNFFEAPGVPKEEPGVRQEGKTEKEVCGSPTFLEKEEPKKSEFKAPEELKTGYTRESWENPRDMEKNPTVEQGEKSEEKTSEETREKIGEEAREEAKEEKRTTYTMKKRLTRSKYNRMLFGVCGGLGEYFDIDPTFIRLAFAALAIQGIGIVLYIILAIIMPSKEKFEMVPSTQGQ